MQKAKKILSLLCLSLLIISSNYSQRAARALEVSQMVWGKNGEQYTNITVPEKWKNESAVILFQDYSHVYEGVGKQIEAENAYHLRVALLDKAAVKEYSEFSFNEKFYGRTNRRSKYRGVTYTGFKIIKSNGLEEVIDLDAAVQITSENNNNIKKIAIPNLQVGDIIDYYYYEEERLTITGQVHVFTPVVSTLSTIYPIVYLKNQFTAENSFHISYKAVNGAPELDTEVNNDRQIFKIEAKGLDKVENTEWMYANRSLPTVKFQVFYSKKDKAINLPNFIGERGRVKSNVRAGEVTDLMNKIRSQSSRFDNVDFETYLEKREIYLHMSNNMRLAQEIYYYLYNQRIGKYLESYYLGEVDFPYVNDYEWIALMESAFKEYDIPSKILAVPNRKYCDINELLFLEELNYLIKVEGVLGEDAYFTNFRLHPVTNQIPTEMQGMKAYEAWLTFKKEPVSTFSLLNNRDTRVVDIPQESIEKNNTNILSDVKIKSDMSGLIFNNTYMYVGLNRDYYRGLFLNLYDYIDEEYEMYDTENLTDRISSRKKSQVAQNINDIKERQKKESLEQVETKVANDYGLDEANVTSFEVTSRGRRDNPLFAYDVKFSIEGLVKQAGPNYLLDAGLLVSTQRQIDEKDRKERKVDVYASNPRSFDSSITVHIPEGYSVQGIEKLNIDVQNETGGLVTTANIIEDKLYITYKKWYANNFEPKENWEKILAFLDAALAFNEVKVLLKKG